MYFRQVRMWKIVTLQVFWGGGQNCPDSVKVKQVGTKWTGLVCLKSGEEFYKESIAEYNTTYIFSICLVARAYQTAIFFNFLLYELSKIMWYESEPF